MGPQSHNVPADPESHPGSDALKWARAYLVLRQHGSAAVIVFLLAYQLGWVSSVIHYFGCN